MPADDRSRHLAAVAARAATGIKAREIIALDVSEQLVLTDVFVVASGSTERQVRSIVEAVEEAMRAEGVKAVRKEGASEGRWVLLDFTDIIVHVQHEEDRVFYALERLWKDCPIVELPDDARGETGPDQAP
ncbi:ribosome silencing factor [Ruania suaedae]|uniref:ribosome silencing factor n=1 Tax=Ruania suaedae TaxID=2897774 RepID=UPI001E3C7749|nr:ribosome silencing factor [Ruania suaedae]UFU01943.1 ribosome silencing factor [Ruania suaedae]